jgi:hypothetical protein
MGAGLFTEAALKANSSNGDRTLLLKYDSAKVTGSNELEIVLKDAAEPLRVHLYYHAYPEPEGRSPNKGEFTAQAEPEIRDLDMIAAVARMRYKCNRLNGLKKESRASN